MNDDAAIKREKKLFAIEAEAIAALESHISMETLLRRSDLIFNAKGAVVLTHGKIWYNRTQDCRNDELHGTPSAFMHPNRMPFMAI